MAHENLKFSFRLKEINNWQPIAGTQDHGTFYMVYLRINRIYSETNDFGILMNRIDCDFKLQNFKGAITMGLVGIPTLEILSKDERKMKGDHQGDVVISLNIAPFHKNDLLSNIILSHELEIEPGMTLEAKYQLLNPQLVTLYEDGTSKPIYDSKNPDESAYLNPVHFERDGDEYLEIASRTWGIKPQRQFTSRLGIGGTRWGICFPNLSNII